MKVVSKKIKALFIVNLLYYVNNFIYVFAKLNFKIEGILALWTFTPFFFVLFSTFVMEDKSAKGVKSVKAISRIDLIIRIAALFANYAATVYTLKDLNFKILILIEIILMLSNIVLEIIMSKKMRDMPHDKKDIGYEILLIHQVIFHGVMKLYTISLYVIAVLFFIPLINTKAIVRKKIEEACKRYKLEIKSQQQI